MFGAVLKKGARLQIVIKCTALRVDLRLDVPGHARATVRVGMRALGSSLHQSDVVFHADTTRSHPRGGGRFGGLYLKN